MASETIEGRASRVTAVCAAVALLSGCAGWPYIGPVPSSDYQPYTVPFYNPPPQYGEPLGLPPANLPSVWTPEPEPAPDAGPLPPAAPPEPEPTPPVVRPDTSGNDGDPASMLPVPRPRPGGDTAADGSPRNPTTGLPPVGPAPPPPTPPAGDDDACVGAWRICHFL